MITALNGLAFRYRTPKDRYILERVVVENLYRVPADLRGETVIDIGAHIGSFTVLAAAAGARVIAIEPEASNVSLLRENVAGNRNRWTGAPLDVAVVAGAIADRCGIDRLYLSESNTGWHSLFADLQDAPRSLFQDVLTVEIGDVFAHYKIERVKLLKIDCEGGERFVLPWVAGKLPMIEAFCIEFHEATMFEYARERILAHGWCAFPLAGGDGAEWRFAR